MMSTSDLSRVPSDWPNRQYSQSIKLSGILWHFQLSKHPDSNTKSILLIHGSGGSAHSWENIFTSLAKNYTVIAVDLPGHGFTLGAQKAQLHIDEITKYLHELLEVIEIPNPHIIVGHSAGANCALALSLRLKKSPAAIIGFNPSFVSPPRSLLLLLAPIVNPLFTSSLMANILAMSLPKTNLINKLLDSTNSLLTQKQRKPYQYLFQQEQHIFGSMNFMAASNIPQLLSKSALINSKFIFLVANHDQWVSKRNLMPVLHQYFPQATIHTEDGGHLFHEVNPKRSIEIILQTLENINPT